MSGSGERLRRLLPNAFLVARREYTERVRSRAFAVTTAVLIPIVLGIVLAPFGLRAANRAPAARVGVWSTDQVLIARTTGMVDQTLNQVTTAGSTPAPGTSAVIPSSAPRFEVSAVPSLQAGLDEVRNGALSGVLEAERDADGGLTFTYHANDPTALASQLVLFGALSTAIVDWRMEQPANQGLSAFHPPRITTMAEAGPLAGRPTDDPRTTASRLLLGLFFVLLIFIALITYGMWVASSVGSEKSSRVMELLIGAATPMQLLLGKVIGMGAAGLTQYALVLTPATLVVLGQGGVQLDIGLASVDPLVGLTLPVLATFSAFFVLGFGFYAFLYAAAASLVSRPDDVQTLSMPLSIVSAAGCVAGIVALVAPASAWAVVLSYVPFTSPFAMLARLVGGVVGPSEIGLALAILVASTVGAMVVASRVYAAGVLLYGQRPGVRTFLAALRTAR